MTPLFPPSHYSDPDVELREQAAIFRRLWQFVGFRHELAHDNDYVCRTIGGRSVFVQNFDGELRAFENVCSHRFNRIHDDGCGNRRTQCRYHGWIYNSDGLPSAIPHRPRFDDLDAEKTCALRLTSWQAECCGGLVFVRQTSDGPSLREYLGDCFDSVAQMTSALGPQIDRNEMLIAANWKVLVENTLESYHVDFVHTDSFKKLGTVCGEANWQWQLPHSCYTSPLAEKYDAGARKFLKVFDERPVTLPGYLHQLVFPNLTIASTYGTSYSIQHFEPLGAEQTRFTSYVFQTQLANEPQGAKATIVETINHSVRDFNRQVFEEDRAVCEGVHKGAKQTRGGGILSDEELRVSQFQRSYVEALGAAE